MISSPLKTDIRHVYFVYIMLTQCNVIYSINKKEFKGKFLMQLCVDYLTLYYLFLAFLFNRRRRNLLQIYPQNHQMQPYEAILAVTLCYQRQKLTHQI